MQQITLEQAKAMLDFYDKVVDDPTDEQQEARDKLEWSINNAHKLRIMFMGRVDVFSLEEVRYCYMCLQAKFPSKNNGFDKSPSSMLH